MGVLPRDLLPADGGGLDVNLPYFLGNSPRYLGGFCLVTVSVLIKIYPTYKEIFPGTWGVLPGDLLLADVNLPYLLGNISRYLWGFCLVTFSLLMVLALVWNVADPAHFSQLILSFNCTTNKIII